MDPISLSPPLAERALERLRAEIASGRWRENLPAERQLAEALRISRPTLRLALARLKEEGMVCVEGRRTVILAPPAKARRNRATSTMEGSKLRRVLFLSPVPPEELPATALIVCQELATRLSELGHSLRVRQCLAFGRAKPERALEKFLADESGVSGWILHRAPLAVQRFFQAAKVPCAMLGYPHAGISLPSVSLEFAAVARHAAVELLRLGHQPRRITVVISDSQLAGNEAVLRGVTDALGTDAFQVLRHYENGTNLNALTDPLLRRRERTTALIVHRPTAALHVASRALSAHDLRIPGDLSLICLEAAGFIAAFQPELARYHHRYSPIARSLLDIIVSLMAGIPRPSQQIKLLPQLLRGASLAAPKRGV